MTTLPPPDPRAAPRRPWLAPAIASGLALLVLAVLLIPGVLRFPAPPPAEDPAALAALEDGNRALETEIVRLRGATEGGVCVYDGEFYPLDVEQATGAPPADRRLDLLPPAPAALRAAPDALPEAPAAPSPGAAPVAPDGTSPDPASGTPAPEPGAPTEAAAFDGTVDELLRRSSVLVLRPSGDSLGTGTGFFVAPDTILTNAHVVADAAEVYVTNELIAAPLAGQVIARTPPEAEGAGPQADFALVRLAAPVASALPLSFAPPGAPRWSTPAATRPSSSGPRSPPTPRRSATGRPRPRRRAW